MQVFTKSRDDEIEFLSFIEKLDRIIENLKPYAGEIDISDIESIRKSFILKTEDFFRNDRKLNIGIIGRVKAGKSSFLNTFLFDGQDVLPKAVTPKTATLTKIEYSSENSIEIEYYTASEWRALEENSKVDSQLGEYKVAREIVEMVKQRNLNPYDYISKGTESIVFESYDKLMNELNQYVGENGKYTPLVKSAVLYVDKEELKEISIVDTPGLNDPITSRTDKTKQFMELCDVVFFLSKATGFLDTGDVDLLTAQLPHKGVKRLVLICSRFDDGLRDTMWSRDSLAQAKEDTKKKLLAHADRILEEYKKTNYNANVAMIDQCKDVVFISSTAHNMANKPKNQYTEQELKVYNDLNMHKELNKQELKNIGNMEAVKKIFQEVVEKKEETLVAKSSVFVPTAREELRTKLQSLEKIIEKRINKLRSSDREDIINEKKAIAAQINGISASLESIFGELYVRIEQNKAEALRELRSNNRMYSQIAEKEGVETHFETCKKSTSKWFMPWTWGSSTREVYSYDERYYYLDSSDALENIRNFVNDSADCIESTFNKVLDIVALKRQLLAAVVDNFDSTDEYYDPAYFKLLVERTLNAVELPVIKIDVSGVIDSVSSQFSGEIRDSAMKANLKVVLSQVIGDLFDDISLRFNEEVASFKEKIESMKKEFSEKLLKNINDEFSIVIEKFSDKENEIERYKEFINKIRRIDLS